MTIHTKEKNDDGPSLALVKRQRQMLLQLCSVSGTNTSPYWTSICSWLPQVKPLGLSASTPMVHLPKVTSLRQELPSVESVQAAGTGLLCWGQA